jgi:hypothetical protein
MNGRLFGHFGLVGRNVPAVFGLASGLRRIAP